MLGEGKKRPRQPGKRSITLRLLVSTKGIDSPLKHPGTADVESATTVFQAPFWLPGSPVRSHLSAAAHPSASAVPSPVPSSMPLPAPAPLEPANNEVIVNAPAHGVRTQTSLAANLFPGRY